MNFARILCFFGKHDTIPHPDTSYAPGEYLGCSRCDDLRRAPDDFIEDIDLYLQINRHKLTEKQRWDLLLMKEQRKVGK